MNVRRIVVIEDDLAIQGVLSLALRVAGYEVEVASSGDAGLELVLRTQPDLVFLDLMLPGMDGLSVCLQIRAAEETRQTPIIMLTAKGEADDVVRGLDAGANDYVTKPFEKEVLLARIRAALRMPGPDAAPHAWREDRLLPRLATGQVTGFKEVARVWDLRGTEEYEIITQSAVCAEWLRPFRCET